MVFYYSYQNALGIFLFRFVFPHENSKTIIGANYLTKENGQSILLLVVYDAIMQVTYYVIYVYVAWDIYHLSCGSEGSKNTTRESCLFIICYGFIVSLQVTWERMRQLGDIPCGRDGHTLRYYDSICTFSLMSCREAPTFVCKLVETFTLSLVSIWSLQLLRLLRSLKTVFSDRSDHSDPIVIIAVIQPNIYLWSLQRC